LSRLDSFIRRLEAQRQCLADGVARSRDVPGVAMELGLGNGRTYDHLREICAGREIFVFDRQVAAHPECIPTPEYLFLGDFSTTLPQALQQLGRSAAALIHVDLGSGDSMASTALAISIAPMVAELMAPGAVLVSDQEMPAATLRPIDPPPSVRPGRYFMAVRQ